MANNELLSMGLLMVFIFFMVPFVLFLAYTGAADDDEHDNKGNKAFIDHLAEDMHSEVGIKIYDDK